jgi:hypothetical protein
MGVALLLLCGSAFALSSVIRKSGKCLHTQPKELRRDIIYIVYENEREKKQIRMKCIYRLRCAQSSLPNMTFFFIPMSMIFTDRLAPIISNDLFSFSLHSRRLRLLMVILSIVERKKPFYRFISYPQCRVSMVRCQTRYGETRTPLHNIKRRRRLVYPVVKKQTKYHRLPTFFSVVSK